MRTFTLTSRSEDIRLWDGIVIFWVGFWLVVGVAVGFIIWDLAGLADTAVESGRALDKAGRALEGLGQVPVIGSGPGEFGTEIRTTAARIIGNGQESKGQVEALAVLVGLSIAIIPAIPVVGFYIPFRLARRRDCQQIRQALDAQGLTASLQSFLAARALSNLGYTEVARATASGAPAAAGSVEERQLALAELSRLGIPPVAGRHSGST